MRLLRDKRGNVLAMTAAAIIPMIGLVGGAVDMGRMYAVKSRLQAACDAGALAGRRVMGSGQWDDNDDRANDTAEQTFDFNFGDGAFGSENLDRSFSETDGTVTGTASVDVPMTLMRVFGMTEKSMAVTCEGQMRIPNTDVMFVLDNSGSMDETIPGDTSGLKKMAGLKAAIRCFYEALARQNITEVAPTDCGTTADPTNDLSTQVQLRFGFVNYDNMVNVGKLLPNDYLVDRWHYQSRVPTLETVQSWKVGTSTTPAYGAWSPVPDSLTNPAAYSSSYGASAGNVTLADGVTYPKRNTTATNDATCSALNQLGPYDKFISLSVTFNTASTTYSPTDNDPPVYPGSTTQNTTATETRKSTEVKYAYRYRWSNSGGSNGCWLEYLAKLNDGYSQFTQTRTGPSSRPIAWTPYERVTWTYRRVDDIDVSGLKAGGSLWNDKIVMQLSDKDSNNITLSGSNTSAKIKLLASRDVKWDGCIEERDTFKNVDGDPSNDWVNYPTSPADAYDMDIDRIPDKNDPRTQWRPILHNIAWTRAKDGANTLEDTASGSGPANNSCLTASRKLTRYDGRDGQQTAQDFSNYVGSIVDHNNTYHDIGLLWGARLMSPTGIFASENATTPGGAQIARHMIFMTDGATANTYNNYASYGLEWWDRRQVDPGTLTNSQYQTLLVSNNNARSNALCTAIKNKNITLWVIYYGTSDTATKTRLTNCATSPTYFFEAKNTTTLIAKFREIADKISNLRLTE